MSVDYEDYNNEILRTAFRLIKRHVTSEENQKNADLHAAISMITDVVRDKGLLLEEETLSEDHI